MANKKAVVVGINEYPPPNRLPSCVGDANTFKKILESEYGFKVELLTDAAATKAAFASKIKKMFVGAKPADRFVIYYSGHGYQTPVNGVLEEFLVLIDGFYSDDDFSLLTQGLPPGVLTVVLDSCFSGGMEKPYFALSQTEQGVERSLNKLWTPTKDDEILSDPGKDFQDVTAYKPFGRAPIDLTKLPGHPDNRLFLAQNLLGESVLKSSLLTSGAFGGIGPAATAAVQPSSSRVFSNTIAKLLAKDDDDESGQLQMTGLLVAACSENETAAASNGLTDGLSAFTFCLRQEIAAGNGGKSTAALLQAVATRLKSMGFRQTPVEKPPVKPPGLDDLPFVTLSAGPKADEGDGTTEDQSLQDLIAQVIAILGAQNGQRLGGQFKGFQPVPGVSKDFDPSSLVAILVPIVRALTKGQQLSPKSVRPVYPTVPPQFDATTGDKDFDPSSLIPIILPIVHALTQGR